MYTPACVNVNIVILGSLRDRATVAYPGGIVSRKVAGDKDTGRAVIRMARMYGVRSTYCMMYFVCEVDVDPQVVLASLNDQIS